MAFRHGVYTSEIPTAILPSRSVDSNVVFAVGAAPVHTLSSDKPIYVNKPRCFYSYDEFVDEFGWDADHFNDYSLAIGAVYTPKDGHEWRGSIGRAYRLPSANELTSNGVHHGAFLLLMVEQNAHVMTAAVKRGVDVLRVGTKRMNCQIIEANHGASEENDGRSGQHLGAVLLMVVLHEQNGDHRDGEGKNCEENQHAFANLLSQIGQILLCI